MALYKKINYNIMYSFEMLRCLNGGVCQDEIESYNYACLECRCLWVFLTQMYFFVQK